MDCPVRADHTLNFLFILMLATINIGLCCCNQDTVCIESEKQALVLFKQGLTDPSDRLASWTHDSDCCRSWAGVVCNNLSGHVQELHLRRPQYDHNQATIAKYQTSSLGGTISPSLLKLYHLSHLDLSNNDFGGIQIPTFLASLRSLRYLNLSKAGFSGLLPPQLGNLSNLQSLSLLGGYSYDGSADSYVENLQWLSGLSLLKHLDLSHVDLSLASDWLQVTNSLPSLTELLLLDCQLYHIPRLADLNFSSLAILDLSHNYFSNHLIPSWVFSLETTLTSLNLGGNSFQGPIPYGFKNMTRLRVLDLSSNSFNSSIPKWLFGRLAQLEVLKLDSNSLQGPLPGAINNLTSLITLDLSYNELIEIKEEALRSLGNLCNLKSIDFSGLKLGQELSQILEFFSGCLSVGIESLSLGQSHLSGTLTSQLGQFKNLTRLELGGNSLCGPLPDQLGNLSSLRILNLADNQLNGTLPERFGQLAELESVDISNNLLNGVVLESHFTKLTRIRHFYASANQLTLRVSRDWVPPFQLVALYMASWHLGPEFPQWLKWQHNMYVLDISNSGISGTIPNWFWNQFSHFHSLNISCNQIQGEVPTGMLAASTELLYKMIDMSSNQFTGPLPRVSSNMIALDLSKNLFSGSLSHFLCHRVSEPTRLELLNVAENLLSGEIPDCWMNWRRLEAIKLSNNNFSGEIPSSMGTLTSLQSLDLRNNSLSGELPRTLKDCAELVKVDIAENEFGGNIPTWIGEKLAKLMILSLRSNDFQGHIPYSLCDLKSVQILDLAHNNLSGSIPRCVNNFTAMSTKNYSDELVIYATDGFIENAVVATKGSIVQYNTILKLVKSLDLSSNTLAGEIPNEVTSFLELQSLNLSNNHLSGRIPENIGGMESLESLDLSMNKLSGEIPASMSSLNFLSDLNLSCNNLTGEIPTSTQLQSLNQSSFTGNNLCGPPLSVKCRVNGVTVQNMDKKNGHEVDYRLYLSVILGWVVGFWAVCGPLLFNRRWRVAYFQCLHCMEFKFRGYISN